MTQYTMPDGLPIPEGPDDITPIDEWFEDQAIATQAALLRPGAVASAAARDAAIPSPLPGQRVWRSDLGREEMYLNIASGAVQNGWYPTAGVMPAAILFRTAAASFTTAGWGVPWETVKSNVGNCLTPNSGNTSHTVNQAGRYRVTIQALQGNTATYYNVRLVVNGTGYVTAPALGTASGGSATLLTTDVVLTAGQTLSVIFHSGANVTGIATTNDSGQATFMTVQYLGPA